MKEKSLASRGGPKPQQTTFLFLVIFFFFFGRIYLTPVFSPIICVCVCGICRRNADSVWLVHIGVHLYLSIASVFPCVSCVCAGFLCFVFQIYLVIGCCLSFIQDRSTDFWNVSLYLEGERGDLFLFGQVGVSFFFFYRV